MLTRALLDEPVVCGIGAGQRRSHLDSECVSLGTTMDKLDLTLRLIPIWIAVLAFPLWWRKKHKRRLGWEVVSCNPLITRDTDDSRLKLMFDGVEVESPYAISVRLTNNGNQAIRKEDFDPDAPITLDFGDVEMLSVESFFGSSSFSPIPIRIPPNKIRLEPLVMNSGRWFCIQVITNRKPNFTCTGQIADVEVRELATGGAPFGCYVPAMLFAVVTGLGAAVLGFGVADRIVPHRWWQLVLAMGATIGAPIVAIAMIVIVAAFVKDRSTWPDKWR